MSKSIAHTNSQGLKLNLGMYSYNVCKHGMPKIFSGAVRKGSWVGDPATEGLYPEEEEGL